METEANVQNLYQILRDIFTFVLVPVLLFVLRVGYMVNKTMQELVQTMYGPRGDNGVYGSVKQLTKNQDQLAQRLFALEAAHRKFEHGD